MTYTVYLVDGDFSDLDPYTGMIKLTGVPANKIKQRYNIIKTYGDFDSIDFVMRPDAEG